MSEAAEVRAKEKRALERSARKAAKRAEKEERKKRKSQERADAVKMRMAARRKLSEESAENEPIREKPKPKKKEKLSLGDSRGGARNDVYIDETCVVSDEGGEHQPDSDGKEDRSVRGSKGSDRTTVAGRVWRSRNAHLDEVESASGGDD